MLLALLGCAMQQGVSEATPPVVETDTQPSAVEQALAGHDHANVNCGTSCSGPDVEHVEHLEAELIPYIFEDWNAQPVGEPTLELETLLFYFHDTQDFLAEHGGVNLDTEHERFLREQLARDTVTVEMRLVEDDGTVRADLPERDIPLKEKQHLVFEGTGSLGHLETGGKVKRVGLGHLWSRW